MQRVLAELKKRIPELFHADGTLSECVVGTVYECAQQREPVSHLLV